MRMRPDCKPTDRDVAMEAAFDRWIDGPHFIAPLPFMQARYAFMAGYAAASTSDDEAGFKPASPSSTSNDE